MLAIKCSHDEITLLRGSCKTKREAYNRFTVAKRLRQAWQELHDHSHDAQKLHTKYCMQFLSSVKSGFKCLFIMHRTKLKFVLLEDENSLIVIVIIFLG
jgi:hypothetical protein